MLFMFPTDYTIHNRTKYSSGIVGCQEHQVSSLMVINHHSLTPVYIIYANTCLKTIMIRISNSPPSTTNDYENVINACERIAYFEQHNFYSETILLYKTNGYKQVLVPSQTWRYPNETVLIIISTKNDFVI